jgi:hypothetical protein
MRIQISRILATVWLFAISFSSLSLAQAGASISCNDDSAEAPRPSIDLQLPDQNYADMTELYYLEPDSLEGTVLYVTTNETTNTTTYTYANGSSVAQASLPLLALRIANGGGGQTGLVGKLALEFLKSHQDLYKNVAIAWRGTNTDGSLMGLFDRIVDIAIVYDIRREMLAINGGDLDPNNQELPIYAKPNITHVWMDHFNYVGPSKNPAYVILANDTVDTAIDKIMKTPNAFWLTRDDDSTINTKERTKVYERVALLREQLGLVHRDIDTLMGQLIAEGAVAMGPDDTIESEDTLVSLEKDLERYQANILEDQQHPNYSQYREACKEGFYRPIRLLPAQATKKAAELGYYTMSDRGIFFTLTAAERPDLNVYVDGMDTHHQPYLLNPADALVGIDTKSELADIFYKWMGSKEAEDKAIKVYTGKDPSNTNVLFAKPMDLYKKHEEETWDQFEKRRVKLDESETWKQFELSMMDD